MDRDLDSQLRDQIAERATGIEQITGDSPASQFAREHLLARIREAEEELRQIVNLSLVLVLNLDAAHIDESVGMKLLGSILGRLQDAITRTGRVLEPGRLPGPRVRRDVIDYGIDCPARGARR